MADKEIFSGKVIYEKMYPRESFDDPRTAASEDKIPADIQKNLTFDEFWENMNREIEYVLLPEREKTAEIFRKTAIEISEIFELDIKIIQYRDHISVNYYFEGAGCMGFLKDILCLADDIAFCINAKEHRIVMSIDYYTHAAYRNGKRIQP